jgi:hypothetical protein
VVKAHRIGDDIAVCGIPFETFVEIGLDLKKRSPFAKSFMVELAHGYYGYMPTPRHFELGGYETWRARSSCLEVDASTKIIAGLEELFGKLK